VTTAPPSRSPERRASRAGCPVCGRRALLWHATLHLPDPWGPAGAYQGCTRAHTCERVPRDWQAVSEGYALAAEAVLNEGRDTEAHQQLAALHRRQAERAAWLHDQSPPARRLAMQLWGRHDLTVPDTAAVVGAALAAPLAVQADE
jgi:hypothetical protein